MHEHVSKHVKMRRKPMGGTNKHGKHRNKHASKQARRQISKITSKKANKQESKQKVASMRDKCRFGSDVHSFIVLKHGRHTNKQDSCMNM